MEINENFLTSGLGAHVRIASNLGWPSASASGNAVVSRVSSILEWISSVGIQVSMFGVSDAFDKLPSKLE